MELAAFVNSRQDLVNVPGRGILLFAASSVKVFPTWLTPPKGPSTEKLLSGDVLLTLASTLPSFPRDPEGHEKH